MATKYRKRPVVIEAERIAADPFPFLDTAAQYRYMGNDLQIFDVLHQSWITTKIGEWIVKGIKGEYYPIANEVFLQTYEPLAS